MPLAGVIALVPDEWGMHWMGRHDTLTRLARHFPDRVGQSRAGVERGVASLPRQCRAALGTGSPYPGFHGVRTGPVFAPDSPPRDGGSIPERRRLLRARRLLRDRGCKQIVLYLWRPEFAPALDLVPHDVSCYVIEDEYTFSDVELPIDPLEAALIARVDQVFISSKAMFERKGSINRHTLCVPNGVDYAAYTAPTEEPSDLTGHSPSAHRVHRMDKRTTRPPVGTHARPASSCVVLRTRRPDPSERRGRCNPRGAPPAPER